METTLDNYNYIIDINLSNGSSVQFIGDLAASISSIKIGGSEKWQMTLEEKEQVDSYMANLSVYDLPGDILPDNVIDTNK